MDERIKQRMSDAGRTGMGAGFAVNQKMTRGLSSEEAEAAAQIARGEAATEDEEAAAEAAKNDAIAPPDKDPATPEEVETANQLLNLMRESKPSGPPRVTTTERDPLMDKALRKNIESSLEPIDVGLLLFNGYAEQNIDLFDGKVQIKLKTVNSDLISLVDRWVKNWVGVQLTPEQKFRAYNQTVVALTIAKYNGKDPAGLKLPNKYSFLQPKFKDIAKIFEAKLEWLLNFHPDLLDLLVLNVGWFQQRVRRAIAGHAYVGQEIKK